MLTLKSHGWTAAQEQVTLFLLVFTTRLEEFDESNVEHLYKPDLHRKVRGFYNKNATARDPMLLLNCKHMRGIHTEYTNQNQWRCSMWWQTLNITSATVSAPSSNILKFVLLSGELEWLSGQLSCPELSCSLSPAMHNFTFFNLFIFHFSVLIYRVSVTLHRIFKDFYLACHLEFTHYGTQKSSRSPSDTDCDLAALNLRFFKRDTVQYVCACNCTCYTRFCEWKR